MPIDAARDASPRPTSHELLRVAESTVFLVDLGGTEAASTHATIAYRVPGNRLGEAQATAEVLRAHADEVLRQASAGGSVGAQPWTSVELQPGPPGKDAALLVEVEADASRIADVVKTMIEGLTPGSLDPDSIERAKVAVEKSMRTTRIPNREIPRTVLGWLDDGLTADPRLTTWASLGSIDASAVRAVLESLQSAPVIVALSADPERVDMATLASIGRVELRSPEQLGVAAPE